MEQLLRISISGLVNINQAILHTSGWEIATSIGTIFAAFIASLALLSSFGYLQKLDKRRPTIISGDRINFVISTDNNIHKIHLPITIVNRRLQPIIIRKITCQLIIGDQIYRLNWNLFVDEKIIGFVPSSRPHPFTIKPYDSQTILLEFFTNESVKICLGKQKAIIEIWADINRVQKGPTDQYAFHFKIEDDKLEEISKQQKKQIRIPIIISVPIEEWLLGWEKNI